MSTVNFRKTTTCLKVIVVCFMSLSFIDSARSQQLDQALAHVDGETSVLVRIDPNAIDGLVSKVKPKDQDRGQTVLQHRLNQTREILDGDPVWLTVGFPLPALKVRILVHDPDGKRIEALKDLWDFPKPYPFGLEQQVVIKPLSDASSNKPADDLRLKQWKKLMTSAKGAPNGEGRIQFVCLPPTRLYETYRELQVSLPDYFGGGPVALLTDGLQSASGSIDPKNGILESTINSASPAAATAFADRATGLINRWRGAEFLAAAQQLLTSQEPIERESSNFRPIVQQFEQSTFQPTESQVRWLIPEGKDWQSNKIIELLIGPAANRSALKRLRNLALGILNYESACRYFPPPSASRGPEGPTGLSWRVHILPFLGEKALFDKFAIDEPWDSDTNIKLLPEMPDIYSDYGTKLLAPVNAKPGYTTVVAPITENTILGAPRKVTFNAISDGSSNTVLLVVVKESLAVPWTAPQDYVFDRDKPGAGLKFNDGKTQVVLCDGSSLSLVKNNNWLRLFEMNDGSSVQPREK